ncbi:MAG: TolC family protein [Candidatus Latescibacteria bacterium]|nr:TolC family protein [Candidatus Latescibacterota bacterium]
MNRINTISTVILKKAFLTVVLIVMTSHVGWAQTYDFDSFITAVKQHNKDLKVAVEDKEMANLQQKEALSTALPKVGFETGYTRNLTDYYMYFDKGALMPGEDGLIKAPFKRDNELTATIALQQTLYSHEVGSAIQASKQYGKLTDYVYEATELAVLSGAKKVFYQCLFLEKVVEITKSAEQNALENYENMKLKYDNGQVSEFELLQAETRWRSSIPEVQKAERNLKLAMNTMKNLAGIDITLDIDIEGTLDVIPGMPEKISMESVFEERPDFQALNWEKELRETNLEATKGAYKPKVTGTLAYAYSSQSNEFELAEENNLVFVGVNLNVPIYTGGYLKAQVQKASVELKKTSLKIDKNKETISTDIVNSYLCLEEAQLRIDSENSTVETAEKAFQIAEVTTRDGLSTQLQLKDARFTYDQAIINYYAAVYDYLAAYFDWEYATGKVGM